MRIEWLNKKSSDRVILFFNGWGMDAGIVSNLTAVSDVLMFYDYRTLSYASLPALEHYREIYVVAWSMGVWAASCVVPKLNIKPHLSVALNGTELPVDDCYGIPFKIYELTEKGMNERGREKFFLRMFADRQEGLFFREQKTGRELPEQCEELLFIRKQCIGGENRHKWDKVYVSEKDVIFPVENQVNWWKGKVTVTTLRGGHYPFSHFKNWEEIAGIELKSEEKA